ncbi:MAG: histidinol dehydrogenase, partial [Pseudomonadales bacterium]|nr:histidinol dehydrogenase [Pseudomonadales bacterium]
MNIARLDTADTEFSGQLDLLLQWDLSTEDGVEQTVKDILQAIRTQGDQALLALSNKFDQLAFLNAEQLRVSHDELQAAKARVAPADLRALQQAAQRIASYHQHQIEQSWSYVDDLGNRLGQKITPLERVGVYVPGGKA